MGLIRGVEMLGDPDEIIVRIGGGVSMATVPQDSGSLKYCPLSSADWTTTLAVAGLGGGNPTGTWGCQDASGNITATVGSQALAVTGTALYQQAATGWTRKVVTMNSTTTKFVAPAGPFNAANSVAWFGYTCMTATPGASRVVIVLSDGAGNTGGRFDHTAAAKIQAVEGANNATTTNSYTGTALFPWLYVVDRAHSTAVLYTELEALTITFSSAMIDGNKGLGQLVGTGDSSARHGLLAAFEGAGAEQFTTSGARSLFTTLNWSPAF